MAYHGRLFVTTNLGYRMPLKDFYQGGVLDNDISLVKTGGLVGIMVQYFPTRNWGLYADFDYQSGEVNSEWKSSGEKLIADSYEQGYFSEPLDVKYGTSHKNDWRATLGPVYSMEKNNFLMRAGLGLGITKFRATRISGYLKEKNSNRQYLVELLPEGAALKPMPLTAQAHLQLGYRWHRLWATTITAKYARFNPGFEYQLKRTALYTGNTIVDQRFDYNRSASDLVIALGMVWIIANKNR
ncbi:hypothetical protein [Niabella hibiscisoli]|uniref:hypothetical protein n=1 Tax=Niabella hibiscisoli TaxID=1825928 RepID=UPI001F10A7DE|nr:hypothetical protein [Niabella hibiscisoli]MCH5720727.1 hypothetical protein [Niabella hibiscisoli]